MARAAAVAAQFNVAQRSTLEATQKALVTLAKREHGKVLATEPRPVSFTRYVDGRQGAAEETVRADGVIHYVYARLDIVAQFAMETLFDLSPVLSGGYRNAHTLFLNGAAVANLKGMRPGDEVAISNSVPYARKIEVGRMTMRVGGSDQVYQQALRIVKGRFGNLAAVRFTMRPLMGSAHGASARDLRYPALIISEL